MVHILPFTLILAERKLTSEKGMATTSSPAKPPPISSNCNLKPISTAMSKTDLAEATAAVYDEASEQPLPTWKLQITNTMVGIT